MSQFFHGMHTHSNMSPIEHVWDALDGRVRQHVPVPDNIQQLRTAIEVEWDNIPQATINSLINSMVTPDTDWFSDSRSYLNFKVSVSNRCISVIPVM